jgi:hypothetical protein
VRRAQQVAVAMERRNIVDLSFSGLWYVGFQVVFECRRLQKTAS